MTDTADSRATAGLVTAARAGDHAAFADLIQRHYPMVHALCTRALGDADLARDAAQEAPVTAMLGLARLRHDDRIASQPEAVQSIPESCFGIMKSAFHLGLDTPYRVCKALRNLQGEPITIPGRAPQ